MTTITNLQNSPERQISTRSPGENRFLTHDECVEISRRLFKLASGGGDTFLSVQSDWTGELRWARNRTTVAGDRRNNTFAVSRDIRGAAAQAITNESDDVALRGILRHVEAVSLFQAQSAHTDVVDPLINYAYPKTLIWSDATFQQEPTARASISQALIKSASDAGMISAGYLNVKARGAAAISSRGRVLYAPQTFAQCSMTVRDPAGTASGWAGASSYDWNAFDAQKLAAIALDKCLRSRNPVAVEPGRYTAILEPQAVYDLFHFALDYNGRSFAENNPQSPFFGTRRLMSYGGAPQQSLGISKLGQRLFDERITVSHDPTDPLLGVLPFALDGEAVRPVTWIDKGVLTNLAYGGHDYAVPSLIQQEGFLRSGAFRMSGGTTSMDEMIASTKRGIIVTRFSDPTLLDLPSLLLTTVTRDGLWLVENGKITHAIKNFRVTESPFFVFNQVQQLGVPVPVFSPERPAIVPPMKVNDFNCIALSDAV